MVQFFRVNSACVYRGKVCTQSCVEVCFAIYSLYFELSCCQHTPFTFQGFPGMFIAQKTHFGSNLNPKLDLISDVTCCTGCQQLTRFIFSDKVYLNLLWLFVWSYKYLKKCFCLAKACGS